MLLLSACAVRSPGETGMDGSADTAGDVAAQCGAWSGVVGVGTRWTYAPTDWYVDRYGYDGTWTAEVVALVPNLLIRIEGYYTATEGYFSWTRQETWSCGAEGVTWHRSEAESASVTETGTSSVLGWRTFSPGWVIRPSLPQDRTDAFTLGFSLNGGDPVEAEVSCVTAIGAPEPRTYAGRTVSTVSVLPVCEGMDAKIYWLGDGVGMVETAEELLIGYDP